MTVAAASERTLAILRRIDPVPLVIFAVFFAFYFQAGGVLRNTAAYDRGDAFFRADTRRAWRDMVGDRLSAHVHTSGHPNFVIFHQPAGTALTSMVKKHWRCSKAEANKTATMLMTAAAAAGTAGFFYLLLAANGVARLHSVLFTCVLGLSSVGIFYASVPETYVFSSLGLTAIAWLASRPGGTGEPGWQLAAVYAWSALTTNIVLIGIWSLARHWGRPLKEWIRRVAVSTAISAALVVAVNLLQKLIFPGTVLFFASHSVAKESHWLYWERLLSPVETTRILLQHQWLSNIIAPEPEKTFPFGPDAPMASIEAGSWAMFAPAWPLFALWSLVLLGAATALLDRRFYTPAILAALGVMAFNFCFFFVFGHDRMLYAALWTPVSVFLVAAGTESLVRRAPALSKALPVVLAVLVVGEGWHNWQFLGKIAALVK
ncbi:MAG: hypothetical protein K1X78_02385 [Verrucomicrobiaceae bacterium]|nr:hypothetical protein [Verrucomicrobiaceae bacterium]